MKHVVLDEKEAAEIYRRLKEITDAGEGMRAFEATRKQNSPRTGARTFLQVIATMSDRYQNQCLIVKVYRWLRWKPLYAIYAYWILFRWMCSGAKIPAEEAEWFKTRRAYASHTKTLFESLAECEMKHYYTFEEMKEALDTGDELDSTG